MLRKSFNWGENPLQGVSTLDRILFFLIILCSLVNCAIMVICVSSLVNIVKLY